MRTPETQPTILLVGVAWWWQSVVGRRRTRVRGLCGVLGPASLNFVVAPTHLMETSHEIEMACWDHGLSWDQEGIK